MRGTSPSINGKLTISKSYLIETIEFDIEIVNFPFPLILILDETLPLVMDKPDTEKEASKS